MQPPFKLYGAELSPYSTKVRSYLRYKGLECEWIARGQASQADIQKYAKLPLIPILVDATDRAYQDSTPIIEQLEALFPEPSILPESETLRFVATLLEDYADEWLNKAMFHYRWSNAADSESAAARVAADLFPEQQSEGRAVVTENVRVRMSSRLHHVGSNERTGPVIEAAFTSLLDALEAHLQSRRYILGGRPSLADFGLAAQLAQTLSDPTPGALMRANAPKVVAWVERVASGAEATGDFEAQEALEPTLLALLRNQAGEIYLPWMAANADAMYDSAEALELEINGAAYRQAPQKYASRAYSELKRKRRAIASDDLAALLERAGCAAYLPLPQSIAAAAEEPEQEEDAEGVEEGEDVETEAAES